MTTYDVLKLLSDHNTECHDILNFMLVLRQLHLSTQHELSDDPLVTFKQCVKLRPLILITIRSYDHTAHELQF